jgi:hypothetical protein
MEDSAKINHILNEIESLDYFGKINIISRVTNMIKHSNIESTVRITQLRGLGKEIWENINIDNYIFKDKLVFLDTAPLIYYIEDNKLYEAILYELFESNANGDFKFLTSVIT